MRGRGEGRGGGGGGGRGWGIRLLSVYMDRRGFSDSIEDDRS